jgi:hypothetical protein
MYRMVKAAPMAAASTLARMAASPSVGPTVRCSTISTGTGNAPARINSARSLASPSLKLPVMEVSPPAIPSPHATSGLTWGLETTSRSNTMATLRRGSPAGAQAASPVSAAHWRPPSPRKLTTTCQEAPRSTATCARAEPTASPASAGGPSRSSSPSSLSKISSSGPCGGGGGPLLGVSAGPASTPSTGRNSSCAVRPMTSTASSGSATPGSSTMMRRSPERCRVGSATPSASTRRRSTSTVRDATSPSTSTRSVSWASRTICVPPSRSSPRRGERVNARAVAPTTATSAATARQRDALDMWVPPALPAVGRRGSDQAIASWRKGGARPTDGDHNDTRSGPGWSNRSALGRPKR